MVGLLCEIEGAGGLPIGVDIASGLIRTVLGVTCKVLEVTQPYVLLPGERTLR
jgi:hypothetical protein